jgi:hypothetical protein
MDPCQVKCLQVIMSEHLISGKLPLSLCVFDLLRCSSLGRPYAISRATQRPYYVRNPGYYFLSPYSIL